MSVPGSENVSISLQLPKKKLNLKKICGPKPLLSFQERLFQVTLTVEE